MTGAYPPAVCGVGDYIANLSGVLANQGLEVSVVTSSYLGIPRTEGENPKVFPVIDSWHMHGARKAIKAIKQVEPDIIVFQIPHLEYRRRIFCNLLIPVIRAVRPSAKVVVTFHEMLRRREITWRKLPYITRVVISIYCADALILVSSSYVDGIRAVERKALPWRRGLPLTVIPVASSIPRSTLEPEDLRALRKHAGFSDSLPLLAYFGFINADKGFDDVLRVLSTLRKRRMPAHLLMIGRFDSADPYHRTMQQRIALEGLQSHVTVTGFLGAEKVADYLAMSDACVLPFRSGLHSKSTTFLAARAQGIFTVTTSTDGTGYSQDENVYYSQPADIESMVQAICTYGRRRSDPAAVRQPDWEEVAALYQDLFRDLSLRREPK